MENHRLKAQQLVQSFALVAAILLGPLLCATAGEFRDSINFNRGWKFQLGDVTPEFCEIKSLAPFIEIIPGAEINPWLIWA